VVAFFPSTTGEGGLAAVKLSDDFVAPPTPPTPQKQTNGEKGGGMESKMFGTSAGGMTQQQRNQKKKDVMSEDFTGKTVQFPNNGGTGIIVAQRPPIAFVLSDSISGGDPLSTAISSSTDTKEENEEEEDDIMTVNVLNTLTTIQVTKSMMGSIVDCYGNPISITSNGSTQFILTTSAEQDTKSDDDSYPPRPIYAPIPKVSEIALINEPLLTGTTMIDALAPLGKGQNMLFVGNEDMDSRGLCLDAIATQIRTCRRRRNEGKEGKKEEVKCVYALTTQDRTKRLDVVTKLEQMGLLEDVVVVSMRDDDDENAPSSNQDENDAVKAAEAVTVAATACSIAESYAIHGGYDTFVVVDNIDLHKTLWDKTTKVLVDVYGVDAVVKDDREGGASSEMRAFYSSLIQRAGMFNKRMGGGSVTLALLTTLSGAISGSVGNAKEEEEEEDMTFTEEDFEQSSDKIKTRIAMLLKSNVPLTSTNLRKIQIPLPKSSLSEKNRRLSLQHVDDLISMSDGQIWLDETLATVEKRSPPIDPQRSITRVGVGADTLSRADAKALRGLVGGLRFELAQASSLDGAEMNASATRGQLRRRDAWLLAMHRDVENGVGGGDLSEEVVSLLAASMGQLDDVIERGAKAGTEEGRQAMTGLLEYVRESQGDVMSEIDDTLDMNEDARGLLESAIESYFSS